MQEDGIAPAERRRSIAMSIAGFDPSSGAGVSADMQVFAAHGLFGISAITALTVQSTLGVTRVQPVAANLLEETLAALQHDLPPAGVKIGMVATLENADVIAEYLKRARIPAVLDPVLSSSSGMALLESLPSKGALDALLSAVSWITPNWKELAILSGLSVGTEVQMRSAVETLAARFPALNIVATAGDQALPKDFLRLAGGETMTFLGDHIATTSTHGTGCAFSSALLAGLISGKSEVEAVQSAKDFVTEALRRAPGLGKGKGPLDLLWPLRA